MSNHSIAESPGRFVALVSEILGEEPERADRPQ
jgi:hypothetical protein